MTPAGRFDLVVDLYEKGLLCHCNHTTIEDYEDENGYVREEIIVHFPDCPGKLKMAELLGYDNGKV